jgi:NAD+ synthase (glutamine-hydrolysing)
MRLALCQINPTVGDLPGNARIIADALDRARSAGADLAVFPELCICGYPPRDLLLADGFVRACADAAHALGTSSTAGLTAVIGTPLPVEDARGDGRIGNGLVAYGDTRHIADYHKRLLPTYDVFDEDRYFTPGDRPAILDVRGVRVGLAVCEDLWKGEDAGFASHYVAAADPILDLARAGTRLIVVPSASPFVLGKGARHRAILRGHAARHRLHVASVNQVGGNDELVFDGHACLFGPAGSLLAAAPGFEDHVLIADIAPAEEPPAAPVPDPLLDASPESLVFRALMLGVRDYLRKTGFSRAIIGLSGGIDSSVTAALAVAALGAPNVLGASMPGRYSSPGSRSDAADLARRLGIRLVTCPIDAPHAGFEKSLTTPLAELAQPPLGSRLPDLAEQNLQSRLRGTTLMALSNRTGALVLTTGNKSELAVGYCTLYGDMNGGLAVLSDISKTMVYRLARWMNAHPADAGFHAPPIPAPCIDKPPSAELAPNQTDADTLPPYEVLDPILESAIEMRHAPARIARETGIDLDTVMRVLRMIDAAEFKRRQLATGLKVTSVAFGVGRRMPIAHRWRPA